MQFLLQEGEIKRKRCFFTGVGFVSAPVPKPRTRQDEEDPSAQDDLGFDLLGRSAQFGAFESQHGDDDGGQAKEQGQDHQSPAGLQVSCKASLQVNEHLPHRTAVADFFINPVYVVGTSHHLVPTTLSNIVLMGLIKGPVCISS